MKFTEYLNQENINEADLKKKVQKLSNELLKAATELDKIELKIIKDHNIAFIHDEFTPLDEIVKSAKQLVSVSNDDDLWGAINN